MVVVVVVVMPEVPVRSRAREEQGTMRHAGVLMTKDPYATARWLGGRDPTLVRHLASGSRFWVELKVEKLGRTVYQYPSGYDSHRPTQGVDNRQWTSRMKLGPLMSPRQQVTQEIFGSRTPLLTHGWDPAAQPVPTSCRSTSGQSNNPRLEVQEEQLYQSSVKV